MDSNCLHNTSSFFVFIKLTFIWVTKEGEEQKVVSFSGKVNGHHFVFWLLVGKIYILNKDFFRLSHAKRHDNSLSDSDY